MNEKCEEKGGGLEPFHLRSVSERTWRKLPSITGARSTPGYRLLLGRGSTQILEESNRYSGGNNGQEWTTGQSPRDTLRFFTLHVDQRNPVPYPPIRTIAVGPRQGENVSLYPDRRKIPSHVRPRSPRNDANATGSMAVFINWKYCRMEERYRLYIQLVAFIRYVYLCRFSQHACRFRFSSRF